MKVAIIHSRYASNVPSGENRVVSDQADALRQAGHNVLEFGPSTDEEQGRRGARIRAAYNVATGAGVDPTPRLRTFEPDVIHVHNTFPWLSQRWLDMWQGPVVTTIHNYRAFCANGMLYRDGRHCFDCPTGSSLNAVLHGCYRGSRAASVPLAINTRSQGRHNRILGRADVVIALTDTAKRTLVRFGVSESQLRIVPNFVTPYHAPAAPRNGWLVATRMTPEKGVLELLEYWPSDERLLIHGDGPLRDQIITASGMLPNVDVRGAIDPMSLRAEMSRAEGLILPSRWKEGLPTVVLEAISTGTPVIAREGSGAADFVRDHGVGVVYHDKGTRDLAWGLAEARTEADALRREAGALYGNALSPESWIGSIEPIYRLARDRDGAAACAD